MNDSDPQDQSSSQDTNWEYKAEDSTPVYEGEDVSGTSTGVPLAKIPPVEWTASEYVAHEKSPIWYLALVACGFGLAIVIYLISKDILAGVVILLISLAMGVYAGRKPADKHYVIDETGIHIDSTLHYYREFRSFSVVEEGAIDSIWLKPLKRLSPVVAIYFSPEDEDKIINVIANFLPHEQKELDAIDRFSKRIRF